VPGIDNIVGLVRELQHLDAESEWVEFKVNNTDPTRIGEYISAIANSAARVGKSVGYVVWGIADESHDLVGTAFAPTSTKIGNEELESWLLHSLTPKVDFRFLEAAVDDKRVVLLEIPQATASPVLFKGAAYVRVGSYRKQLKDHPQIERELWRSFDRTRFEDMIAVEGASDQEVCDLLDVDRCFDLLGRPRPLSVQAAAREVANERMTRPCEAGGWSITNMGALLIARNVNDFDRLARKLPRVVRYRGTSRTDGALTEAAPGPQGYAVGFEQLIEHVAAQIPAVEKIEVRRVDVHMVPIVAIRELIANALIHQDMTVTGAGPMIEVFDDRVEVTNPGPPLIDPVRLLDTAPRSRNERTASFMRRAGICEERGTGVDKVVLAAELDHLPAPEFRAVGDNTVATLFSQQALNDMDKSDRVRAVYQHVCLKHVNRRQTSNSTIRERFGIEPQNAARASRLLNEAVEAGMIRPRDPDAAKRLMRYVPFWA
jgi:ATP-dependent DNA helicase RecG